MNDVLTTTPSGDMIGVISHFTRAQHIFRSLFNIFVCVVCKLRCPAPGFSRAGWTGTMMVKRGVLEEAGMFTEGQLMANDIDMWWRIAYRYPKIGYNAKPLAVYHRHIDDSITKKHRDPEILCDLIARHVEIAGSLGAFGRFVPCAVHMIKYWNYVYLFDERKVYIPKILKRFKSILPISYRSIMKALTMCPLGKPLVDQISWRVGIRR